MQQSLASIYLSIQPLYLSSSVRSSSVTTSLVCLRSRGHSELKASVRPSSKLREESEWVYWCWAAAGDAPALQGAPLASSLPALVPRLSPEGVWPACRPESLVSVGLSVCSCLWGKCWSNVISAGQNGAFSCSSVISHRIIKVRKPVYCDWTINQLFFPCVCLY